MDSVIGIDDCGAPPPDARWIELTSAKQADVSSRVETKPHGVVPKVVSTPPHATSARPLTLLTWVVNIDQRSGRGGEDCSSPP